MATEFLRKGNDRTGTSVTGGIWRQRNSGNLLSDLSSGGPESFEIEEGSVEDNSRKFFKKKRFYGLCMETDDIDDDGAHKVSGTFALFSVFIVIFIGILTVKHLDSALPVPLQVKDIPKHPNCFIEERAGNDLHKITSMMGVRVSGSLETDNKTVDMFLDILREIELTASDTNLEVDVQRPTGAYISGLFGGGHTSAYSKLANLVVKLAPKNSATNDGILVNCHFDTKPGTPGATDDMVSCVVMLEIIRILAAEKPTSLKNPIIFLFNGAEELGLQGSHGFIKGYDGSLGFEPGKETGHRWVRDVKTFVNLEGAGSGGREILFQTGPGNSWTLEAYASAAPYPYGSVVGEEAFQFGLIPSDTDFRIFRDYGNLAGLDMAFTKNGWVYHTKWDTPREIPPGSIQHMGANSLAILRHFSEKVDFSKINFDSNGKMIYFDVLGLFLIHYPRWAGMIIDCVIGVGTIAAIIFTISRRTERKRSMAVTIIWLPVSAILSWAVGIVMAVLVALFFNACGYFKPFYSYPTLAVVIFAVPAAISQIICQSYALNKSPMQSWMAQKLALALILVVMTFVTRAVYIISINLLFSVVAWYATRFLFKGWPRAISLSYLILGELIPFLLSFYLLSTLSDTFVPTLGRSGSETNANLFFGVIVTGIVLLLIWNGFCFIFVPFRRRVLWMALFSMFFVVNTLLVFGFIGKIPYQEKTPMRLNIVNVERSWYAADGLTVNKSDSGYWFWPYDSNTKDFFPILEKSVSELSALQTIKADYNNCQELYCAQPFIWPMESSIKNTYWLPSNRSLPNYLNVPVTLTYNILELSKDKRKVDFSIQGPTQITMVLSPGPSYKLVNWTLLDTVPSSGATWKDRSTYFIYHSRGYGKETIEFSCEFDLIGSARENRDLIGNVQYSAFYLYGDKSMTHEFRDMVDRLPSWVYAMSWTSVMKMYEIRGEL